MGSTALVADQLCRRCRSYPRLRKGTHLCQQCWATGPTLLLNRHKPSSSDPLLCACGIHLRPSNKPRCFACQEAYTKPQVLALRREGELRRILAELNNPFYTLVNKVCKLPDAAPLQQLLHHQSYLCARPHCLASLYSQPYYLNHITAPKRGGAFSPNDFEWLCATCYDKVAAYRPDPQYMQYMV